MGFCQKQIFRQSAIPNPFTLRANHLPNLLISCYHWISLSCLPKYRLFKVSFFFCFFHRSDSRFFEYSDEFTADEVRLLSSPAFKVNFSAA